MAKKRLGAGAAASEVAVIPPENLPQDALPTLQPRQERFAKHYAHSCNASDAARKAGYSVHSARVIGYDLLTNPAIQAHVRHYRKLIGDLHFDAVNSIFKQYDLMRRADPSEMLNANGDLKDPQEWPEGCKLLINGIEVEEQMRGEGDEQFLVRVKKVKLESRKAVMDSMRNAMVQMGLVKPSEEEDGTGIGSNKPIVLVNVTVGGQPAPHAGVTIDATPATTKKVNGNGKGNGHTK